MKTTRDYMRIIVSELIVIFTLVCMTICKCLDAYLVVLCIACTTCLIKTINIIFDDICNLIFETGLESKG